MSRGLCLALAAWLGVIGRASAGEDPVWAIAAPIDVHAHLGTFRGYDLSLPTLLDNLERHAIRLAMVSNIDGAALPGVTGNLSEAQANEVTRSVVAQNPKLKALAWARPGDDGASPANLEPLFAKHGFVGLKLHPQMNHFDADAAVVDGYVALAEKHGVPVVIHCQGAAPIHRLARRHPTVPVILYHANFGGDHDEAIQAVESAVRTEDADLYLETAQVDADTALAMVKRAGATRVLFGTDATYHGAEHYRRYTALVKRLHEGLSPADFRLVMSGNAERLFRLTPGGR